MPDPNPKASKPLVDQGDTATPEDVATLYSWANLHGAKYRDFSASRAQAREEARLRVEEALAEEKRRQEEEAERQRQEEAQIAARLAAEAAEAARQAEAERLAEIARQAEAERQAVLAAQEAQRQAAQQRAWQPPVPETYQDGSVTPSAADNRQSLFNQSGSNQSGFGQFSAQPAFQPADPALGSAPTQPYGQSQNLERTTIQPQSPTFFSEPQRAIFNSNFLPSGRGSEQHSVQHPQASYSRSSSSEPNPSQFGYPKSSPGHTDAPNFLDSFAAQPAESYSPSPWHPSEQSESRERPAWLAPEPPVSPATHAHPNQFPSQRSYANAPLQPAMPTPIYAPGQGSGQGTGHGWAQATGQGPANNSPGQNPGLVDDTLAGSRDRIANRWYALKSVFDPQAAPVEQAPAPPPAQVPILAVFSLAGGVGKTSLVASLGRALSSRGERVLLVDTAAYGLLPFFFGARDQRPGMLRTFNPPGASADAPIQLVTLDPEGQPPVHSADPNQALNQDPKQSYRQSDPQASNQDWLAQEVGRYARGANRVLIDLPTASGSTTRRVLRLSPVVLVPVLPDMNSVVSVGAIEAFFRHNGNVGGISEGGRGKPIMPYYVLNQFDYSLPLHLDVREILREQIGDRLLPFALRRSPAVSEALAEGMTVMDYAPGTPGAEDYANLAGWVRSLSAPAIQSYRGVRWSER